MSPMSSIYDSGFSIEKGSLDLIGFVKLMREGRECCSNDVHSFSRVQELSLEFSFRADWAIEFLMEIGARCDCQVECLNMGNGWLSEQWDLSIKGVRKGISIGDLGVINLDYVRSGCDPMMSQCHVGSEGV